MRGFSAKAELLIFYMQENWASAVWTSQRFRPRFRRWFLAWSIRNHSCFLAEWRIVAERLARWPTRLLGDRHRTDEQTSLWDVFVRRCRRKRSAQAHRTTMRLTRSMTPFSRPLSAAAVADMALRCITPDISCINSRRIVNISINVDSIGKKTRPQKQIFTSVPPARTFRRA